MSSIGMARKAENYYDWRVIFPELEILKENIEIVRREAENLSQVRLTSRRSMRYLQCSGLLGPKIITRLDNLGAGLFTHLCIHFRRMMRARLPGLSRLVRIVPKLSTCYGEFHL